MPNPEQGYLNRQAAFAISTVACAENEFLNMIKLSCHKTIVANDPDNSFLAIKQHP